MIQERLSFHPQPFFHVLIQKIIIPTGRLQGDGVYSAIVIRDCKDPNLSQYDYDRPSHTLIVADWSHYPSDIYFPGYYLNATHIPIKPDVFLINGLGSYKVREYLNPCL